MDKETLNALEGSILKWDGICYGCKKDEGTENCPLCIKFYSDGLCTKCPIRLYTGRRNCQQTPYWKFHLYSTCQVHLFSINHELLMSKIYAEKELIFLLKLLPDEHPWKEMI